MARILIFDDDASILQICEYILKREGYEVHSRSRCDDVIQVMKEVSPDLVLMDNWIPEMGGVEATAAIKGHAGYENTPVVYFSANSDVRKLAEQAGADTFIAKPFDLEQFQKTIADALR